MLPVRPASTDARMKTSTLFILGTLVSFGVTACSDDAAVSPGDSTETAGDTDTETDESGTEGLSTEDTETEDTDTEDTDTDDTETEDTGDTDDTDTEDTDDTETSPGVCGDGIVDDGEACDDGDANADDAACTSACELAVCGDGLVWASHEECDDGGLVPGDGCSETCTEEWCTWDVDALDWPLPVHAGFWPEGQIVFDDECDLLVAALHDHEILRVSQVDGSVSVFASELPGYALPGLAVDPQDGQVYAATIDTPGQVYALDDMGQATHVADVPMLGQLHWRPTGIAVAPEGFGQLGGHLIVTAVIGANGRLFAIDPQTGTAEVLGLNPGEIASPTFAPDGQLYVANVGNGRIDRVSPNGVFLPEYDGFVRPNGVAFSPDGARMAVAHEPDGFGRVELLDYPDGGSLSSDPVEVIANAESTGVLIDAAHHVLVKTRVGQAVILDAF